MVSDLPDAVFARHIQQPRFECLGEQSLKNIEEPIVLWQVLPEGASVADYALADTPNNLPLQLTSFIGRDGELADAAKLLERSPAGTSRSTPALTP